MLLNEDEMANGRCHSSETAMRNQDAASSLAATAEATTGMAVRLADRGSINEAILPE